MRPLGRFVPECCCLDTAFSPWAASMKAFAVALLLSLSLLGAERALAGDLPGPNYYPPNSYYPPATGFYAPSTAPINWGGVYIGLNGGYNLGTSDISDSTGSTGSYKVNGGLFGGTLGVNYAGFGDWVLLGFEGDFDWSGATGGRSRSGSRYRLWRSHR